MMIYTDRLSGNKVFTYFQVFAHMLDKRQIQDQRFQHGSIVNDIMNDYIITLALWQAVNEKSKLG